jgi:hypothetical protein
MLLEAGKTGGNFEWSKKTFGACLREAAIFIWGHSITTWTR